MKHLYLLLNDIRSMENVGSIFRTSDAAGVEKIFLCGITPKPPRKEIDKTALGAVDTVEWEYVEDIKDQILKIKKDGFTVIALEQDPRSIPYTGLATNTEKVALVVGNEVNGIAKEILNLSDQIIEIPMHGAKNSLNVSVATGIALYKIVE